METQPDLNQQAMELYARLPDDPTASADLIALLLEPLLRALARQFARRRDDTLVWDAATDSLFALVQHPERFDPRRGRSLFGYLIMDASGDLKNTLNRKRREISLDLPESEDGPYEVPDVSIDVAREVIQAIAPDGLPDGIELREVLSRVRAEVSEPRDRELLELIIGGERKTEVFAEALDLTDLPLPEQRRLVKQHKDRLNLQLRRLGQRIRDEHSL